jgi:hypothetical protein
LNDPEDKGIIVVRRRPDARPISLTRGMIMREKLFACAAAVALIGIVACEDVVGPGGEATNLSYAPCLGATDNPTWFAVQDGDGSWERVTASSSGSFDFTISSGKGGMAMVTPDDGLFVIYATTEELQANLPSCNGSVRTVSGNVTGYTTADNVSFSLGTSNTVVFGSQAAPAAFSLPTVDATATDLVAIRYRVSSGGAAFEAFPNNIFLRRSVSGTLTSLVDFSSTSEAGAPLQRNINVTNLASGEALSVLSNVALKSTLANIAVYEASAAAVSGSAIVPFYGVAGSRLTSGESQMVLVGAAKTVGSTNESRFQTFVFTDPVDQSLTLGPTLGAITVTGTSRPSATYNVQAAYDKLFDVVFSQGNGSTFRQVEVLATSAYLGGATSVNLTVPNLVGVSGFTSNWLLVPGVSSTWTFLATDADLSVINSKAITYQGADRTSPFTP